MTSLSANKLLHFVSRQLLAAKIFPYSVDDCMRINKLYLEIEKVFELLESSSWF